MTETPYPLLIGFIVIIGAAAVLPAVLVKQGSKK